MSASKDLRTLSTGLVWHSGHWQSYQPKTGCSSLPHVVAHQFCLISLLFYLFIFKPVPWFISWIGPTNSYGNTLQSGGMVSLSRYSSLKILYLKIQYFPIFYRCLKWKSRNIYYILAQKKRKYLYTQKKKKLTFSIWVEKTLMHVYIVFLVQFENWENNFII